MNLFVLFHMVLVFQVFTVAHMDGLFESTLQKVEAEHLARTKQKGFNGFGRCYSFSTDRATLMMFEDSLQRFLIYSRYLSFS